MNTRKIEWEHVNSRRVKDTLSNRNPNADKAVDALEQELHDMGYDMYIEGGYNGGPYSVFTGFDSLTRLDRIESFIKEHEDFEVTEKNDERATVEFIYIGDSKKTSDSAKRTPLRKRISDAFNNYLKKDLKNLQAYRRVTDSEGKIKENVVFLIEDSDVLAVFPNTYGTATRACDTMVCYSHNGQHGVCTYDYANTLKTAVEDSYKELQDELSNYVGYSLNIVDSLPSEDELKKNAQEIRDSYKRHKRQLIEDARMLARGEEIEYNGKRGTVQYALFHGQEPVIIRWNNEEGSEEFEVPYNQVAGLKVHDSAEDTSEADVEANVENIDSEDEVTDNCGGKKKKKDSCKKVKITKRSKKA